jgi:hypothetical protein
MENAGGYLQGPHLGPEINIYNEQTQEKPRYTQVPQGVTAVTDRGNNAFPNPIYPQSFDQNLNPNFEPPGQFADKRPINGPAFAPSSVEIPLLGIQSNFGNELFHTSMTLDPFVRYCSLRQIILLTSLKRGPTMVPNMQDYGHNYLSDTPVILNKNEM